MSSALILLSFCLSHVSVIIQISISLDNILFIKAPDFPRIDLVLIRQNFMLGLLLLMGFLYMGYSGFIVINDGLGGVSFNLCLGDFSLCQILNLNSSFLIGLETVDLAGFKERRSSGL